MTLLDPVATQQTTDAAMAAAKTVPIAMAGQFIFGYSINEWAAIIGIVVTLTQFAYWIWDKFFKRETINGCEV